VLSKYINIESSFEDLIVEKLNVKIYLNFNLQFNKIKFHGLSYLIRAYKMLILGAFPK
jgi:hypothetical protein